MNWLSRLFSWIVEWGMEHPLTTMVIVMALSSSFFIIFILECNPGNGDDS